MLKVHVVLVIVFYKFAVRVKHFDLRDFSTSFIISILFLKARLIFYLLNIEKKQTQRSKRFLAS